MKLLTSLSTVINQALPIRCGIYNPLQCLQICTPAHSGAHTCMTPSLANSTTLVSKEGPLLLLDLLLRKMYKCKSLHHALVQRTIRAEQLTSGTLLLQAWHPSSEPSGDGLVTGHICDVTNGTIGHWLLEQLLHQAADVRWLQGPDGLQKLVHRLPA